MTRVQGFLTMGLTVSILWTSLFVSETIGQQLTTPCSVICTGLYKPVCGSDGATYDNDCELIRERTCNYKMTLNKVHDGACVTLPTTTRCETDCILIFQPVCGSDGVTYTNECFLNNTRRCSNPSLYKVHDGPCFSTSTTPCGLNCPDVYAPVCGSDGRTYSNGCELNNVKQCRNPSLVQVHVGPCFATTTPCGIVCPPLYQPVCGSDGSTYSSDCHLNAERICRKPSLFKVHNGPCGQTTTPPCGGPCPAIYQPVCGSDGLTYGNDCELANARRCRNPSLYKQHNGHCRHTTTPYICERPCPLIYAPVCGSDWTTYGNQCELDNERRCRNPRLYKKHDGECKTCDRVCPQNYSPVCGSDGVTYTNDCYFEIAKCKNPHLTKRHDGKCHGAVVTCDKPCPDHHQPVCGTNDVTYNNYCLFEIAQCKWHIGIRESNAPCSSVMKPLASILLTLMAFIGSILLVLS